jgi:hypothetical protein
MRIDLDGCDADITEFRCFARISMTSLLQRGWPARRPQTSSLPCLKVDLTAPRLKARLRGVGMGAPLVHEAIDRERATGHIQRSWLL